MHVNMAVTVYTNHIFNLQELTQWALRSVVHRLNQTLPPPPPTKI